MLVKLGYEVNTCCNGQEAVDYYRQNADNIDLVILDMIMPVKNGHEALMEIRQINQNVKALISSGFNEDSDHYEMETLEIKGFVQKPYRMAELAEKISKAMT